MEQNKFYGMKLENVCKLSVAVCNSKQIWDDDKCRCECIEDLVDKIICDKGFSWNLSDCSCECDKSCGISENIWIIRVLLNKSKSVPVLLKKIKFTMKP